MAPSADIEWLSTQEAARRLGITTRTLRCHQGESGTGTARAACTRLDSIGGPVGPTPDRQMCSMLYGGPQTARVTGVWRGTPVDESYNRTNGCQTSRWERMVPVLPAVGPAQHRAFTPRDT